MALTKEQIFKADDTKRERVDVPEWANGDPSQSYVYVKRLKVGPLLEFYRWWDERRSGKEGPVENYRAKLLEMTVISDDGEMIMEFSEWLGRDPLVFSRIAEVSESLNGLSAKEQSEKKDGS